jgi:hypothetical protein
VRRHEHRMAIGGQALEHDAHPQHTLGSRLLAGSSRTTVLGLPSSADAAPSAGPSPRRIADPRSGPFRRLTRSITSSTRCRLMPLAWATRPRPHARTAPGPRLPAAHQSACSRTSGQWCSCCGTIPAPFLLDHGSRWQSAASSALVAADGSPGLVAYSGRARRPARTAAGPLVGPAVFWRV